MIRINLISEGRKPVVARKSKAKVSVGDQDPSLILLGAGAALGLLVALGWYFMVNSTLKGVQSDVRAARDEVRQLEPILKEVEAFKRQREELNTKINLINELTTKRRGPVHLMDQISRSLPDLVWLVSMQVRGKNVELSGQALNTNAIASFIENLSLVPEFKEPDTKDVSRVGDTAYRFSISFLFEIPQPQAEGEEGAAEVTDAG